MIRSPLLLHSTMLPSSDPYTRPFIYDLPVTAPTPRHRPTASRSTSIYAIPPPSLPLPTHPLPPPFHTTQLFWLSLYFTFNLSLTLFNKAVLLHFPFPYSLTALHALCGSIGGYALLDKGFYVPARKLGTRENVVLGLFSVLYAVNIVVSNVSLQLVTVPVRVFL